LAKNIEMERDYILRHAKDMGKILALLLGLALLDLTNQSICGTLFMVQL
jgi:hypothetical protein